MHWLELKVPPPLVTLIFAGAMFAVTRAFPGLTFQFSARPAISLILAALGLMVALAGVLAFRRKQTTVNPLAPDTASSIVSDGIYRYSRNPMYLGLLLLLSGWVLYLANAAALLLLPVFAAYMTQLQIKPEERALASKFGVEYEEYMARVRRWI